MMTVLITGATGAIGGALALEYAAPGVTLILQGRNAGKLQAIQQQCQARGAVVQVQVLDLRDIQAIFCWLETLQAKCSLDLVFLNAGININTGPQAQGEAWDDTLGLLQTNVLAVQAMAHAVLPPMRARGAGQLVLISSLAAYYGLPDTPSYSASKAAVKAYGEALRGWLAPEGVKVNVVMPGYVDSHMCRDMPGPKPFLWQPAKAAARIRRGVQANCARIQFPWLLATGCWWLAVLPPACSQWILKRLGYGR